MGTGSGLSAQICLGDEVVTTPAISAIAAASSGTNLVTFASAHGLLEGDRVTLAGFTPSGYNATWTVLSVPSSTTLTIGAGLAIVTVVGTHSSTTWGRKATPSRFYELVSEKLKRNVKRIETKGIRASQRIMRSDDWAPGPQSVGGSVALELSTKGYAWLFGHCLGGTIVTAGAGPYTHTISRGDLTGRGMTGQVGRPTTDGVVEPFTYTGLKVASWELSVDAGSTDPAKFTIDTVGKSELTTDDGETLVANSYTSGNQVFNWSHLTATVAGSSVRWRKLSLKGVNGLNTGRYTGGSTTIDEPLENDLSEISGVLTLDFNSRTQYAHFVAGDEMAMVLTFTRGTDIIAITLNVRYDGETPDVSGRDLLNQAIPFKAVATGADSTACTIVVTSAESTP
jgi:hypothetical protein